MELVNTVIWCICVSTITIITIITTLLLLLLSLLLYASVSELEERGRSDIDNATNKQALRYLCKENKREMFGSVCQRARDGSKGAEDVLDL